MPKVPEMKLESRMVTPMTARLVRGITDYGSFRQKSSARQQARCAPSPLVGEGGGGGSELGEDVGSCPSLHHPHPQPLPTRGRGVQPNRGAVAPPNCLRRAR